MGVVLGGNELVAVLEGAETADVVFVGVVDSTPAVSTQVGDTTVVDKVDDEELASREVVAGVKLGLDNALACCSWAADSMQMLAGHPGSVPASYNCPGGCILELVGHQSKQSVVLVPAPGAAKLVFLCSTMVMYLLDFGWPAQAVVVEGVAAAAGVVYEAVVEGAAAAVLTPSPVRQKHLAVVLWRAFLPSATVVLRGARAAS